MFTRKLKVCALCDTKIDYRFHVCRRCFPTYQEYKNTRWMQELIAAQVKQVIIDQKEIESIESLTEDEYLKSTSINEIKSRPSYTKIVLDLYITGMKLIQIHRKTRINYSTVKDIVRRYKKKLNKT